MMLQRLKKRVEERFGREITYQKDCINLASNILNSTGCYISPTTLRRVFGFLPTNSNPSGVTLNTLSNYCGFDSWNQFLSSLQTETIPSETSSIMWKQAQEKAADLSKTTIDRIKKSIPLGYSHTVARQFAQERLQYFINSNYRATAFVGPGGYGKSTLLVKWYEKFITQSECKNDIILFLQASSLISAVTKHFTPDTWLQSILDINPPLPFHRLVSEFHHSPRRFILILDALDEIIEYGSKAEQIHQVIHQLVRQQAPNEWFKVILSSRLSSWKAFQKQELDRNLWFFVHNEVTSHHGANMPPLNEDEIQRILNATINREQPEPIIVEELPAELLNSISYPYYLQLYIDILRQDKSQHLADRLDLLTSFVKSQIYQSAYSDEMLDILDTILNLSDGKNNIKPVKKNDLKRAYPIHLKTEEGYFSAYNELLSFGILSEENIENRFGSYTKCVRVSQDELVEFLIIQRQIEKHGGITIKLFKIIEKEYAQSKLLPNLISLLFQIAYKERISKVLKSFFELKEGTLSSVFSSTEVSTTLRNDDLMRHVLIPHYSKNDKAKRFLFEGSFDVNNIVMSGRFLVQNYLLNCETEEAQFYAKTLLYLAAFLNLDTSTIKQDAYFFNNNTPTQNAKPLIAGLWFSCKIMCWKLIHNTHEINSIVADIDLYAHQNEDVWARTDRLDFELGLCSGLIIARHHGVLLNRLKPIITDRPKEDKSPVEKAIAIFYHYALWNIDNRFEDEVMLEIEYYLNELPWGNSYHAIIIGRSFLSLYYLKLGSIEKAYELFQKAIQVSTIAGYRICEVKLLKHLVRVLRKLGETSKAEEYEAFALTLLRKTDLSLESV